MPPLHNRPSGGNPIDGETIESLALRAQRGEDGSFDRLAARMRPRLRAFLIKRLGDEADAEDITQETFVKALASIGSYNSNYRFSTWLFTIAGNLANSHFRRKRPLLGALGTVENVVVDAESVSLADRDAGALLWRRASKLLPPRQYTTLWLRYGEDLDIGEIAQRTGRSSVSIRVSLYRARRRLAAELSELS